MPAIDPITGAAMVNPGSTPARTANDQFGKDTFLKLLVAQLKYQNPMSPKDGSEFLAQTAQFTMVEKLTAIEQQMKTSSAANEVLQASAMIGRSVTAGLRENTTPTATSELKVGGNLPANAAVGSTQQLTAVAYRNDGKEVPLRLEFTKLPAELGSNAWQLRTWAGSQLVSGPNRVDFDADGRRTTPDPRITVTELERIAGTAGKWSSSGMSITLGSTGDVGGLRSANGNASLTLREQNGSDGKSLTGIVSGVKFTSAGPLLRIGSRDIPMLDVLEVHLPTS